MSRELDPATRRRIEALIEAYGFDPARWPVAEAALLRTAVDDPAIARRIAEARRLEEALALAERAASEGVPAGLEDRIVARAVALQKADAAAGPTNVVAFPGGPRSARAPAGAPALAPPRRLSRTAGALAASLVAGLIIGASGLAPLPGLAGLFELTQQGEDAQLLVQSDTITLLDEDIL